MRVLSSAVLMLAAAPSLFAQAGPSGILRPASAAATAMSENVTIKTDNSTLNGVIENAAGNERHGAILIVTNGEAASTATAKLMAKAFAAKGIVALTYESPIRTAADAEAGIDLLRQRGDVVRDKVGIVVLDGGAAIATACAKGRNVLYTVSIDKTAKPEMFAKSQKTLLVQASDDAFSASAERMKQSVEKRHRNVTLWLAPSDDVTALNAPNSTLLDRVTSWAVDRTA